jgi:hypothetical protein
MQKHQRMSGPSMERVRAGPMIIEAKPEPITVNCADTDVIIVDFIFRTGLSFKGLIPTVAIDVQFHKEKFP